MVSWETEMTRWCRAMRAVRSGGQGIKPEMQHLTEGDLALALPSADLRHPTFIVVAARTAFVCVCVYVCVGSSRG